MREEHDDRERRKEEDERRGKYDKIKSDRGKNIKCPPLISMKKNRNERKKIKK